MTPTGSTYLALEVQGLRQLLAEKDAEIERLAASLGEKLADLTMAKEFITKLCDALTRVRPHLAQPDLELIRRAREATKA